ncbi:MAG: tryptophan synthase subunit alpha [Bacteroidota bacterium]
MSRLNQLFENKKNILSVYFTSGYPKLDSTAGVIRSLVKNGVDLIEVGFPFSDPLADGPVIQQSSVVALQNGISTKVILDQLKDIRRETEVPLIAMGYLNPIMQYGVENFLRDIAAIGFDGVILPDLPIDVYQQEYAAMFEKYGLKMIFLITPQTSDERIRMIDSISDGFIYMVSSASTTGAKEAVADDQERYFKRIAAMNLKTPLLIGFGISNKATFSKACEYASGAIVGSAYIKAIGQNEVEAATEAFVQELR